MKIPRIVSCLGFALSLAACTTPFVKKEADSLGHQALAFKIPYKSATTQSPLGEQWVDKTKEYSRPMSIAYLDDPQAAKIRVPTFEAFYENKASDGQIYLMAFPLPKDLKSKHLPVLLNNFVENMANKTIIRYLDAPQNAVYLSQSRRMATKITRKEPLVANGVEEGIVAFIDVAIAEQIALDPDSRHRKTKVAFIKPKLGWKDVIPKTLRQGKTVPEVEIYSPSLVILAYENQPEYFDANLAEFDELLGRVRFTEAVSH